MIKVYLSCFFTTGFNNVEAGIRVNNHNYGKYFFGVKTLQNYSDCSIIYFVQKIKKVMKDSDEKFILIVADKRVKYLSNATYLKKYNWTDKKGNKIDKRVYEPLHQLVEGGRVVIKENLSVQDNEQIGDLTEDLKKAWFKNEFGKSIES